MINDDIVNAFLNDPVNAGALLKSSFKAFHEFFCFYVYHIEWDWKPFHEKIVEKLEDFVFGRNKKRNLVINIPPRFGKTKIMESFEAWSYLLNPYSNVMHTSYSDTLIKQSSKNVKNILASPAFQSFSGGLPLRQDSQKAEYWQTEPKKGAMGGAYRASTLSGALTGFGFGVKGLDVWGGCCIIDDPLKASLVTSRSEINTCKDFYLNALISRRNNPKAPFIMIMQRLDPDDLTGYVLENEADDWEQLKLSALNEETGEALWEETMSAEVLLKMKKSAPTVYYGQYQQEPIVLGGEVIQSDWFQYYNTNEYYAYQNIYGVCDTAQKKGESNDFTVMQLWGLTYDNSIHLLDMVRGKFDAVELEKVFVSTWEKWSKFADIPPYGIYIEDKSSGIGLIQTLRTKTSIPFIPIQRARYKSEDGIEVKADKYSRALAACPHIASGRVKLPNNAHDEISSTVLSETSAFRSDLKHKHDDIVDCVCDACNIAFGNGVLSSIYI